MKPLRLGRIGKNKGIFKKLFPFILIIGILSALAIFLTTLSGSTTVINFPIFGNSLKSSDNRVNLLFLGIAGGTHDGANLTDTIMVASYNLKTNQLYLFSIPRDLWLPSLKAKANAVYELGLSQSNGLGMAKTIMGNILGIPIHYGLRIDFRGFIQSIDTLGGIDLIVDNSFDDYNYPIEGKEDDLCGNTEKEIDFTPDQASKLNIDPGKKTVLILSDGTIATDSATEDIGAKYFICRYEHIHFDKGLIHMDGAKALKFVRSRHGTSGEASDFARSSRQEKVLQAVRSKLLSLDTIFNLNKISDLIKTLGKSIDSDISPKEGFELYKLSKKLGQTHSLILNDSNILIHPPAGDYGGAYVLISQDDDFSTIQGYVKKILEGQISDYEATASARPGNK